MKRKLFLFHYMIFLASVAFADGNAIVASEGLRDVRAPVYFPANYFLLFAVLLIALIASLAAFIYLKRKKADVTEEKPVDTRSPWEIAYDQFVQLAKCSYLEEGRFKEYYSELSGIIRYYFENRFNIRASEMTTEEFLWSFERLRDLKTEYKETLKKFMAFCDIIKFAKHIPRVEEAEESFQFARQLVEETKINDSI